MGEPKTDPRLKQVFPDILSITSPIVEASTFTLTAASLLRAHHVASLQVVEKGKQAQGEMTRTSSIAAIQVTERLEPAHSGEDYLFVSGYSILSNLVKKEPGEYYSYLFEPCKSDAIGVGSISVNQDLRDLLELFRNTRFGFACFQDGGLFTQVNLLDVMQLYVDGRIETDLRVKDVASTPYSLPGDTKVKDALDEMFSRRTRTVFIRGTKTLVSDREVISFIFSPRWLGKTRDSPRELLDCTIAEVGLIEPEPIEGDTPIRNAARLVAPKHGNSFLCEQGIVTPWDLVMKPWNMGRLVLSGRPRAGSS